MGVILKCYSIIDRDRIDTVLYEEHPMNDRRYRPMGSLHETNKKIHPIYGKKHGPYIAVRKLEIVFNILIDRYYYPKREESSIQGGFNYCD